MHLQNLSNRKPKGVSHAWCRLHAWIQKAAFPSERMSAWRSVRPSVLWSSHAKYPCKFTSSSHPTCKVLRCYHNAALRSDIMVAFYMKELSTWKSVFAHTHVYYVVRVARGRWFVGGSDAWNVSVTAQACSQEKRYDLKLTVYIMLYDTVYFQEARLQHEHVQTYITWSEHLKTYTFYNLIIFP